MSFDIYGNRLERGHCEVHPHVHEDYPCSLCMSESRRRQTERREYDEAMREQETAHYARMEGDIELDSWLLTNPEPTLTTGHSDAGRSPTVNVRGVSTELDGRNQQFLKFLVDRIDWLTSEISGGGNFEHLNTRRSECAYIRERFERAYAVAGSDLGSRR